LGNDTGHVFFGVSARRGGYYSDVGGGAVRQVALYSSALTNAEITTLVTNNISGKVV
jgi:hypothetical protein